MSSIYFDTDGEKIILDTTECEHRHSKNSNQRAMNCATTSLPLVVGEFIRRSLFHAEERWHTEASDYGHLKAGSSSLLYILPRGILGIALASLAPLAFKDFSNAIDARGANARMNWKIGLDLKTYINPLEFGII